jgi:subtilase family serine protease
MPRTPRKPPRAARRLRPAVDALESRQLLAAVPASQSALHPAWTLRHEERLAHVAELRQHAMLASELVVRRIPGRGPIVDASAPVTGYLNPTQVQTAYGVNLLPNQGEGQTIGIVDEDVDSGILSDANTFSAEYGLPQFNSGAGSPTFTQYQDTAFGSVPTASPGADGVGVEISLDVEWAHAMAPKANILLVDVSDAGSTYNTVFQELLHGVQYAAGAGASVVSLSYGYTESGIGTSNVQTLDNTYLAPTASNNAASRVAVTVSTGDSTYPGYPATSPNVIGVGGTSLYLASARGIYNFETAWGGLGGAGAGGGGVSSVFATPTFQSSNGVNLGHRSIPDVSMVADPVTGVSLYDSYDGLGWTDVGGTSLAAPVTAGIIALAQEQRVDASKPILNSVQINTALYSLYNSPSYSTYFHDITLGNNNSVNTRGRTTTTGFPAKAGYDEATGIGSIIANTLVPYLASL